MDYWASVPDYVAVVADEDDDAVIVASGNYYAELVKVVLGLGLDQAVAIHAVRGLPGVPSLVALVDDGVVTEVDQQLAELEESFAF